MDRRERRGVVSLTVFTIWMVLIILTSYGLITPWTVLALCPLLVWLHAALWRATA